MASQILANVEEDWRKKRKGVLLDLGRDGVHRRCSFLWADHFGIMSHSKVHLEQKFKDLIEEAGKVDQEPKPASLWWTNIFASEGNEDMIFGHLTRLLQIRF